MLDEQQRQFTDTKESRAIFDMCPRQGQRRGTGSVAVTAKTESRRVTQDSTRP